ncbi:hypothetical protein SDC9_210658 [bioreactor metagenome]|uniref:Uncharacterized protein n=1 Tax=bioreactor metagenome TaxID=1076179 RepID=A0A645JGU9_9ZZZZ
MRIDFFPDRPKHAAGKGCRFHRHIPVNHNRSGVNRTVRRGLRAVGRVVNRVTRRRQRNRAAVSDRTAFFGKGNRSNRIGERFDTDIGQIFVIGDVFYGRLPGFINILPYIPVFADIAFP